MKIQGPSGRIYEWTKDTPPTEADMTELKRVDSLSPQLDQKRALDIEQARRRMEEAGASPEWAGRVAAYKTEIEDIERRGGSLAPVERTAATIGLAADKAKDMLVSMGIRGGGQALGQIAGQETVGRIPFMPKKVARGIGGGVGGAVGSIADQTRLIAEGKQQGYSKGQIIGDAISGANPGRGMISNALTNVAATQAESIADTGKPADLGQTSAAAFTGGAGAATSRLMTGSKPITYDEVHIKRLKIARDLRKEGVVIDPAEIHRGSSVVRSLAGKQDIAADISQRNQAVWQRFAREDLGLNPKDVRGIEMKKIVNGRIVDGEIEAQIKKSWEPYEAITKISEQAKKDKKAYFDAIGGHEAAIQEATSKGQKLITEAAADIGKLKTAQHLKHEAFKKLKENEPGAWEKYQAAKQTVDSLEDAIDLAAQSAGDPKLLARLREARVKIARGYAYLNATDSYTGLVNPKLLSAIYDDDPIRLTGRAKQIAEFEKSFGRNSVEASQVPTPGSQMAANFALTSAAQGNPAGAAAATAPMWRAPFREFIASDSAQRNYLKPQTVLNDENFAATAARLLPQAVGRREELPDASFLRYMQNPAPFLPTF